LGEHNEERRYEIDEVVFLEIVDEKVLHDEAP
jgi:hypothetical protein